MASVLMVGHIPHALSWGVERDKVTMVSFVPSKHPVREMGKVAPVLVCWMLQEVEFHFQSTV